MSHLLTAQQDGEEGSQTFILARPQQESRNPSAINSPPQIPTKQVVHQLVRHPHSIRDSRCPPDAVHEDSHLHFTYKMQKPGRVNIFVLTRTEDERPAFSSNYQFDKHQWWSPNAGEWRTVTIPLAKFRRLSPGRAPIRRVIPFQVLFSSPEGDRGLVIDRMWVTRGGPGVVETKPVK